MSSNTPNTDDLQRAMAQADDEGYDVAISPPGTSDAKKKPTGPNTILANTTQVLVKWGIPAAVVAAVVALAIYLVRTEVNKGAIRELVVKGARTVVGDQIRDRVRAQVRAYRVLGRVAVALNSDEADDDDIGSLMTTNLNERSPAAGTATVTGDVVPPDAIQFADGMAAYVEALARTEGIEDELLELALNNASDDAIDEAFTKRIKAVMKKEELSRLVESLTSTLLADLHQERATVPQGLKDLLPEEFRSLKDDVIKKAVEQIDTLKLLTETTTDDLKGAEENLPANLRVTGVRPYEGLGAAIKGELRKL